MKSLSIDIETYSTVSLQKSGVYRYAESDDFEILLFGYSVDGGKVKVIDLAMGEQIPKDIIAALTDETVVKWAFNAQFERVCLSRYLSDLGISLDPYYDSNPLSQECAKIPESIILALHHDMVCNIGIAISLEGVGAVLGLEKQKLSEVKI
jgi:DNA polymerase